jgi:hypothetical protein
LQDIAVGEEESGEVGREACVDGDDPVGDMAVA